MNKLSILTYHSIDGSGSVISVTPEAFKAQMAVLADAGFRGVSLREALSYREGHNAWPERSVALTFDDGYANFYEDAAPTLAEHRFTATVFVVSGHVGRLNDWAPPPPGFGARAILSRTQIVEMSEAGIEVGARPPYREITIRGSSSR